MHIGKYLKVAGLSAMASFGLSVSAFGQPYQHYQEKSAPNTGDMSVFHHYFLDFTTSSANPAYNWPTFTNPRNNSSVVRYAPHRITAAVSPGGCFEISSSAPMGSDILLSVQNNAGTWKFIADDNAGLGQFLARVYVKPSAQYEFRISEYSPGNNSNQPNIYVKKLKLNPGSSINSSSCRVSGIPYWQHDLNSGNPYTTE